MAIKKNQLYFCSWQYIALVTRVCTFFLPTENGAETFSALPKSCSGSYNLYTKRPVVIFGAEWVFHGPHYGSVVRVIQEIVTFEALMVFDIMITIIF